MTTYGSWLFFKNVRFWYNASAVPLYQSPFSGVMDGVNTKSCLLYTSTHWQTTQNNSCTARTVPLSLYLRVASHQRKVLFSYYHHIPGGRKKQGLKNYLVLRLVWALRKVNTRDIITTDNPGPEKSMNPAAVKACRVENKKGGHTLWKTVLLSSA